MPRDLPSGTVTFLFTDIEGSTRLLRQLGPQPYAEAMAMHRRLVRDAIADQGGVEVDTQGDAFFVAFPSADGAVAAALAIQRDHSDGPIRIRMGIHTGNPHLGEEGYIGDDVHLGARITAAGHGGQVLLSRQTRELVDVEASDLGEHRVKDFPEPVWIFQLGGERFPPLRSISNTNLPRPASSFVGREDEVAAVVAHLRNGARLLTLTGPGGSGKTRLAIEAATELIPDFKSGVFWVGLAPLRDASLVVEAISQTLGARDGLAEHIGERELLLLLDNLEQVIDAAPALASLVETCPNLHLLVTSRERLRVRGEVEYPVEPLANPEAVELFTARSRIAPDEVIADLCRRLDNLPLAVELAAARTAVLTPAQILARLGTRLDLLRAGRDADVRQQTLRATIEWSHELLDEPERQLFGRLSVFAGGCTVGAAETVVDADLDVLQSLADKSLIRHSGGRFWMLESIRDFAAERLEISGEAAAIRERHLDFFLAVAIEGEVALNGPGVGTEWLDALDLEADNFRAALDLAEVTDVQRALRLADALTEWWDRGGYHLEGLSRFERLLRADNRPTAARAYALNGVSQLAALTGDLDRALEAEEEAIVLHREHGDRRGEAISQWGIGYLLIERGDPEAALPYCQQASISFRELDEAAMLMWSLRTLGFAHFRLGDLDQASQLYREALDLARRDDDYELAAAALGGLVGVARRQGRLDQAAEYAREGLRQVGTSRNVLLRTAPIVVAAAVVAAVGRPSAAVELVGYADAQYEDLGAIERWVKEDMADVLAVARDRLDAAEVEAALVAGRRLSTDAAFALAERSVAPPEGGTGQ